MQERDVVAVVSGGPYARVDAHVAHHSADDEFPYARPAEGVVEIRLEKSVRRVFDDDGLAVQRLDRAVYLGTGRIRQEEGRAGTGVDMPDVENGPVLFAETPQRQPGLCGGLVRVGQFPSAAGEIVVLDIDQEKCRIHAVPPGVVPTIAACGGKYSSYFFVGMPSAAGMMPLRSKMPACPFSSMYSTPISCMIRTARNSFSPRSVRK